MKIEWDVRLLKNSLQTGNLDPRELPQCREIDERSADDKA